MALIGEYVYTRMATPRAWVMALGRRGSVFVSVCLSQDGRSNHVVPVLVCLSQG